MDPPGATLWENLVDDMAKKKRGKGGKGKTLHVEHGFRHRLNAHTNRSPSRRRGRGVGGDFRPRCAMCGVQDCNGEHGAC